MCQLEKPPANEITEPLAFTVCKLELHGKAIVLQSRSRCIRFSRGQLWAKRKESDMLPQNKSKPMSKCRSAVSRRHSLQTWDLLIERRALVTFSEILPSIWMKFIGFLLFWSWLCFAFYPRTFLHSGTFHPNERIWFQKHDHGSV